MCRWIIICVFLIFSGCEKQPPPLNWPSFPEEVIRAGRASSIQSRNITHASDEAQSTASQEQATEALIPATSEAILDQLKHVDYGKAQKNIERLGAKAVGPLLEIIADDSIPLRYRDMAVMRVAPLGTEDELQPKLFSSSAPIEMRSLTKDAGRITDAVLEYVGDNPAAREAGSLQEIAPLDRLLKIINLIASSSGKSQARYIRTFCTLTHTQFPTIPEGFCGNTSPESRERAVDEGAKRQQESVDAIKRWWLENGKRPSAHWAIEGVRRHIKMEATRRAQYLPPPSKDEYEQGQRDFFIREYDAMARFGPSVYDTVVEEFFKADVVVKPYILYLIAATRHEHAAEFVAERLHSRDPNLQHAAVEGLRILGAVEHADGIKRLLSTAEDKVLVRDAIEALSRLIGADAIEAAVDWLNDSDHLVRQEALSAISPHLTTHANRLREIADSHRDKNIAKKLRSLLDQNSVSEDIPFAIGAELLSESKTREIMGLLRSGDTEKQRAGIAMVSKHELAELVPEMLELLRSSDRNVRNAAVGAVVQMGVPAITLERASPLLGQSLKLDRHIAAYCYAKYGREALPLVRKVALQWRDPAARGTAGVAAPAVGLIQVLIDEKVEGIENDIVAMINEIPNKYRYVSLLSLMDDPTSAAAVGEILRNENGSSKVPAIHVALRRNLVEHADVLFDLAMSANDTEAVQRALTEFNAGKLSSDDYRRINQDHLNRPANALAATRALLVLGDPRAWQAVVQCLEGKELNWHKKSGMSGGVGVPVGLGDYLSRRKREYHREIHDLLLDELAGENRDWVQATLATALVIDPDRSDSDVFWEIASAPTAGVHARILCAVALSKLGDERVIPILQELLQPALSDLRADKNAWSAMPHFGSMYQLWQGLQSLPRNNLLSTSPSPCIDKPALTPDHTNVAQALKRLGDETLIDAALRSLIDARGQFDTVALGVLMELAGTQGSRLAHDWLEQHDPELTMVLDYHMTLRLEPEFLSLEALRKLPGFESILVSRLSAIVAGKLPGAADALAAAFGKKTTRYWATNILDGLCQLGDVRGLELASAEPLLLSGVGRYLPDSPHVDFPPWAFKYNRVEDGLALQQWYTNHKQGLRWHPETKQFRLAESSE